MSKEYAMDDDGYVSRSQKKRDSTALQVRGAEIAALSPADRRRLPLSDDLADALRHLDGIPSREGKRRQMQYIGRVMRELDEDERAALLDALEAMQSDRRGDAAAVHRIEAMRDALLHEDERERARALDAVSEQLGIERSRLAHLVQSALADKEKKRPPKHARELFRYLRDNQE